MKIFITSKSDSNLINGLKTLSYSILFWATFLLILPSAIYKIDAKIGTLFSAQLVLGVFMSVLFSMIGIWSGYTMSQLGKGTPLPFDCAKRLVIKGPYKFIRNPMAFGGIGQGISVGLIMGSSLVIVYSLLGAILWHIFVRPHEEVDLEKRFGQDYLNYKRRVYNWIPSLNFLHAHEKT